MSKKKAHGVQLLIRCVVTDPNGKVISDTGRKPARSFVIQFLEWLYILMNNPGLGYATGVGGGEILIYSPGIQVATQFIINAGANNSLFGIVVGTGDTAEDNEDNKLETQLLEGAGAGQITHGAMVMGTAGVVGANVDLVLKRAFTNNTGSAILVKEAGIYFRCTYAGRNFCIVRDVFPGPVNVPDKCSLAVFYTVRTTV